MLSSARIEIHDHLYNELRPRMADIHFFQKFVDSADGKRRHALPGMYVSTYYSSPRIAQLNVIAVALQVDIQAQIMVIAGDQIFSHGCREEEQDSFANILALFAESNQDKGVAFGTIPVEPHPLSSLAEYSKNLLTSSENKGGAFGTIPVTPATDIFSTLK